MADYSTMSDEDLLKIVNGNKPSAVTDYSAMSDDELMKIVNGSQSSQIPSPEEQARLTHGDKVPNSEFAPEWKKNVSEVARPVLNTVGMVGGGLLAGAAATPETLGLGAIPAGIAGAGLGYAAGEQVANKLDEVLGVRQAKPVTEELMQAGKDVGTGAAMEMGGQVIGAAVKPIAENAGSLAKRIYQSGLKPSTTLTEQAKSKVLETGLNEAVPIGQSGLDYSKKTISEINNIIKGRISEHAGEGITVSKEPVNRRLENLFFKQYEANPLPSSNAKSVSDVLQEFDKSQPAQIPIAQAQEFKQTLNKELNDFYKAYNTGKPTPPLIVAKAKAEIATALREEISNVIPELKTLNQREGNLIEFNKQLNRAVNRMNNNNLFGLVKGVLTGNMGMLKAVALDTVLNNPRMTSRIAIGTWKAAKAASRVNPKTVYNSARAAELAATNSDNGDQ